MPSITDLDYTDNLASGKKPILTDWRESLDSIETYINESVKDNLVQLAKDCFPSGYPFDSDGDAQFSSANLFNKQFATDSHAGGHYTLATTGSWTDVDASNISIQITPDYMAGDFKVTFSFAVETIVFGTPSDVHVRFRLTDGSENSTQIATINREIKQIAEKDTVPVTLIHVFEDWSAALKTVKLQYYVESLADTTVKVWCDSTSPICMIAEKI